VASLEVGGVSYTRAEALVILQQAYPPSDAPGILAQQLIAAKLNVFSGAENEAIEPVIEAADIWLVAHPLHSKPSSAEKQEGLALKDQLEAFNTGNGETPVCTAGDTSYPDAILVVHSDDGGRTFSAPVQVATVSPFDQGTSEYSFRTNAYPTMAVDETGRAYLAWATRGLATYASNPSPDPGDARIVVTTSNDGTTWTAPSAIDQPTIPGHQLFPSLTYNAGKLVLVYNDFRSDVSGVFERYVVDLMDATHPMRHTVDVRAAIASPADGPVFTDYSLLNPSSQVSRYPFIVTGSGVSDMASLQLQYNPPNLPMFQLGHAPFFGDYLDVAGAPRFVPNADGSWKFNTATSTAPVYHAVWTDNRDVVGPPDGDWTNYIPPGQGHTSIFDGSTEVADCATTNGGADRTQMRNQNIYTARLVSGLFVAVPSNARPLSTEFQRAFVIFVQNATDSARPFRLEIMNQPAGGAASFQQFSAATTQTVTIGAYSSVSQSVFVTSSNPAASVDVQVTEANCQANCLQSTVRLNPDPLNPPPANATLGTGEIYTPAVYNPAVYNPAVYNPAVLNPAVLNVETSNPAVLNYQVENPAVYNPAVLNPAVLNPAVFNLTMTTLAFLNPAVLNPAVLNPAVLNPAVLNPAVLNPAVLNPAVLNPAVFNPAVLNPAVLNPAVFNPAVYNPAVFNTALCDGTVTEANFQVLNSGNATAAYSFNLNLANQQPGLTYQLMIYRLYFVPVANGCQLTEAAHQELLVNDLSPNLNAKLFDPNGGDSFFLNPGDVGIATLRVIPTIRADNGLPGSAKDFNLEDLSVSVVAKAVNTEDAGNGDTQASVAEILAPSLPPLVITSTSLPSGVVGSPYSAQLTASGGSGSYVWSAVGTLPPGLTLSPAGALTGTPTVAGDYTFTLRVADGTQLAQQSVTFSVALASAPVAVLAFTVQPTDATGGQPMASVAVQALDGTSSPVPGASITVGLGTTACSAATLTGGTTALTDATGVATFPGLINSRGGWGYTLRAAATANPAINVTSNPFNVEGFCATGSLNTGRGEMPTTLLNDGRVLVAGGTIALGAATATAELFDPAGDGGSGSFASTGDMSTARTYHQATLLPDGRALISGGDDGSGSAGALSSAEIFDPTGNDYTGSFASAGDMSTARTFHQATLLADGTVLISGGNDSSGTVLSSAELFDPAGGDNGVGAFTPTGSMGTARNAHTATALLDGRVLVAGGVTAAGAFVASAEIYDPESGTFSATGSMSNVRGFHTATLLPDGRVLIAGGRDSSGYLAGAELFDPSGNGGLGSFSSTSTMNAARGYHTATLLPDGKVLVSGGTGSGGFLDSAEIFDPTTATFAPAGTMSVGRRDHGATLVPDGRVLIAGGVGAGGALLSGVELFFPLPPTTFMVTNTNDSGAGSLRQAILDANAHPGLDAIHFNIPVEGIQTISPASALPVITDPVWLDATTQPGYAGTPLIRLDGASSVEPANGLEVNASNTLIKGFVVTRFPGAGIVLHGSATHIERNFIGTDGASPLGNLMDGIIVGGGSGNVIADNVVSGTSHTGGGHIGNGIDLSCGAVLTIIIGNRIGTNAAGTAAIGNQGWGIFCACAYSTIVGGTTASKRNLISGNAAGIALASTHDNIVKGNWIGLDISGTAAIPNWGSVGIGLQGTSRDLIGGQEPGAGNVISGNPACGVEIFLGTSGARIIGNLIGTDANGTAAIGNQQGVVVTGASGNTVSDNVISGNSYGLVLAGNVHDTVVAGNRIGTDVTGEHPLGNATQGVILQPDSLTTPTVFPDSNLIGGVTSADANVISGNGAQGIFVLGGTNNTIRGNRIGTNSSGTAAVPNGLGGIYMKSVPSASTISGNAVSSNIISGNGSNGVTLDTGATGTVIVGNTIGANASVTAPLGNNGDAIGIYNGASGNTVSDNTVVASTYNGVRVYNNADGNTIRHNWIGTNAALATGLGNEDQGISVEASIGTTIGGTNAGDGNVVAYNAQGGILLESAANNTNILGNVISGNGGNGVGIINGSTLTTVVGNRIGTDASGTVGFPNTLSGVSISASNNVVGDYSPPYALGNIIAFNGAYGIEVASGSGNDIVSNSIFGNASMGIFLAAGANNDLEAPVIASAVDNGTNTTVTGTVNLGAPGATAVLQFFVNDTCDPSGYGEGQTPVGVTAVVAGGDGTAPFSADLPSRLVGKAITATTSTILGPGGSTSDFSGCLVVNRLLWARQVGIGANDSATAVATDGSAVYVAGTSTGSLPPGQTAYAALGVFVRKYDLAGKELWTRQLSASGATYSWIPDVATGIAVDGSGVYVTGYVAFSALPGQTDLGGRDAFVRKIDLDGNELWTHQFGTAGDDDATSVAVGAAGVYVAGWTTGTFPGQTSSGSQDAFLRKYDSDGNELWTQQFGTSYADSADAIAVDASGVYVAGGTSGAFPGQTSSGSQDALLRKYDSDGNELWTQQFGSAGNDDARALSIDTAGVYVAGSTSGTLPGQTNVGGEDAFVRKYDPDGNALWTQQFGTTGDESADALSFDASGVYVAGSTTGTLPGQSSSGDVDAFVRKLDPGGDELWTRQFGSASADRGLAIAAGTAGVYVGGDTNGALPGQTSSAGKDAYVRRLDPLGNEVWSRQFGAGAVYVSPDGMSIDTTGIYVSGYAQGVFPGHPNAAGASPFVRKVDFSGNEVWLFEPAGEAYDVFSDGSDLYVTGLTEDVLVGKLDLAGNLLWSTQFGTTGNDVGDSVVADASGAYVSGRVQGTLPGQTSAGDYDAFIRKVDPAGNEVWTRQYGTAGWDSARRIAIDASAAYITGGTDGAFLGQSNLGSRDAYVRKVDLDGNELWTRQFGTGAYDYGWGIAVDASGVYVVGETDGGTLPGQTSAGGIDAFIRKYDLAGNELWTRQFGGAGDDVAYAVSTDTSGVYVTGYDAAGAYVRKYDPAGTLLWTYQFGNAATAGWRVCVDAAGVYVSGAIYGELPGQTSPGGADLFFVKLVKW
jgi:parallel beta-helix repeat protein